MVTLNNRERAHRIGESQISRLPAPRTIEQVLADLRKKNEKQLDPDLARMIRQLEAELAIRRAKRRSDRED